MIDVPSGAPDFGERVLIRRAKADQLPSFEAKTADGIFLAWNMEVIQGADVLIYQAGTPFITTVSAPKPWPNHIIPTRQRWRVFSGPKGVQLWMGDQGGMVWGERTKQIEEEMVTFEERRESSPYERNLPMLTQIDLLVKELLAKKKSEDMSTYAQFYPGIITGEDTVDKADGEADGIEHGGASDETLDCDQADGAPATPKGIPKADDEKESREQVIDIVEDQPKKTS